MTTTSPEHLLTKTSKKPRFEVIIVDNSYTIDLEEYPVTQLHDLAEVLREKVLKGTIIGATLSNIKKGVEKTYNKVTVTPFSSKEGVLYQLTFTYDKKVTHQNCSEEDVVGEILKLMESYFRNATFFVEDEDIHVLTSKKGKITMLHKKPTKKLTPYKAHNRKKKYIIEEGEDCDFLLYLGVMSSNRKIHAKKYDKFKQINKFLEIIENSLDAFDPSKPISILDFGCGKAYLTFALYYYLVKKKGYQVDIIGLDLKEDVIDYCNHVATELDYKGLQFLKGDIKDYNEKEEVDMVITLHACDTATDAALIKATHWNAKVILSVPCCQHELFNQIKAPVLEPMLKHGLIKERLSSLVTDAMRTQLLEVVGYEVTVIEFIDMEHTPKNLMIKAVKTGRPNPKAQQEALESYERYKEFWGYEAFIHELIPK